MKYLIVALLALLPAFAISLRINPVTSVEEVQIDTVVVEGVEYHKIILDTYPFVINGSGAAGLPSLPYLTRTFLLPPDTEISGLTVSNTRWVSLPGKYHLYPAQSGIPGDSTFTLPDSLIYSLETPFPDEPVSVPSQGTAMGYSIATVTGTPIRYTPSDSLVEVLTRMRVSFELTASSNERISPTRETELSAEVRRMNIEGLVANPVLISLYEPSDICDRGSDYSGLNIFDAPSPEGDGVDMVIITSGSGASTPDLTDAFQEFADYRTSQGIITVVRTVQWIEGTYSGCDTPQKIRNFIRDAHENWGIQAVILGGDDWIVPARLYGSLSEHHAADDYYADIDGNWVHENGWWYLPDIGTAYVDIQVGRLPVDDVEDVQTITEKIVCYETTVDNSTGFCRSLLLLAEDDNEPVVAGFIELVEDLTGSGAYPDYINTPEELYWDPPTEVFTRENTLQAFDTGYNVSLHADHSDLLDMGTGTSPVHDYDFSTMCNTGRTGVLWTVGCWLGFFTEADCFAEAALLTSSETGFSAVIASSTQETQCNWMWSLSFADALYSTGWTQWQLQMPVNWPVSYLGQAFRHQKNFKPNGFSDQNSVTHHLFGDPFMFVWRGSPEPLIVECSPSSGVSTGTQTITVTVTKIEMGYPTAVADALVCIWNENSNDVFALGRTNSSGVAVFSDIEISQPGTLTITATKRRDGTDVASCLPVTCSYNVQPSNGALVTLDTATIDDDDLGYSSGSGDGVLNPGETIELEITAVNTGLSAATGVTAELTVIAGGNSITVIDDDISFPDIPAGAIRESSTPFIFSVDENVDSYSAIEFEIEFTYNLTQSWSSPFCCSVFSEQYAIPLSIIDYALNQSMPPSQVIITLSDFRVVNTGVGDGENLEMTISSITPAEPFTCNTIQNLGSLSPDECLDVSSQLTLVITPDNPAGSPWTNTTMLGGSLDIQVSSNGGDFEAKTLSFDQIQSPGEWGGIGDLDIVMADESSIEMSWEYGIGAAELVGFYLDVVEGSSPAVRSTSLPIPVEQGVIDGLDPVTEYRVWVNAVDAIGRIGCGEYIDLYTTQEIADGWPVQLSGNTGSGPVIVNMDGDSEKEIVAVSSFGEVYLIQDNGQMETIDPPIGLTFDRFMSLAVGDVDSDNSNEIVVSCQNDILDGYCSVLLYDQTSPGNWSTDILDTFGPDESISAAYASGSPVLFQANNTSSLEIAIRSKGDGSSLHVWQWNSGLQDWIEPTGFPISLNGSFFSEPIAVDFDDDGYDELIVTQLVNNYSALHVVDFYSGGFNESNVLLTDLGTDGRVFSSIAAVKYDHEVYIIGAARYNGGSGNKLFAYNITTSSMEWVSGMLSGADAYTNMGGPAIGHANNDGIPDVFYMTKYNMTAWQLDDGTQISTGTLLPYQFGSGYTHETKSATIAAGATVQNSIVTAPLIGFCTNFFALDPAQTLQPLNGFPTWTRTGSWTAPSVGDVDNDGRFEFLTSNQSGELTLYEWDSFATSECWPMYQHDSHRTGFFNSGRSSDGFDVEVVSAQITRSSDSSTDQVVLTVNIFGSSSLTDIRRSDEDTNSLVAETASIDQSTDLNHSHRATLNTGGDVPRSSNALIETVDSRCYVSVAVQCDREEVSTGVIPLVDGRHTITLPVNILSADDYSVIVDPENRLRESDESNNALVLEPNLPRLGAESFITFQNPSTGISATVYLAEALSTGLTFTVYSLDGRVQYETRTEALSTGLHTITLSDDGRNEGIPPGVYFIRVEGMQENEIARKVVVI